MKTAFDAFSRDINYGEKLLVSNHVLYVESRNTFFLVRFFRWIRGQYSHTKIHRNIRIIANNALNHPNDYRKDQWKKLQNNIYYVYNNYTKDNFRAHTLNTIRKVDAQIDQIRQQKPAQEPPVYGAPPKAHKYGAPPKGYKGEDFGPDVIPNYNPADFDREEELAAPVVYIAAPVVVEQPNEMKPLEPATPEELTNGPEGQTLAKRWAMVLEEEEDFEDLEDILFESEPIASKIAEPNTLINWVLATKSTKTNKEKIEKGKTVDMLAELLKALGIETPRACMEKNIEPTLKSFEKYFALNRKCICEQLIDLDYLVEAYLTD